MCFPRAPLSSTQYPWFEGVGKLNKPILIVTFGGHWYEHVSIKDRHSRTTVQQSAYVHGLSLPPSELFRLNLYVIT